MSGPFVEDPRLPDHVQEWLDRYEAKMADLERAREERARSRTEGVEAWKRVEERVDEAHAERRQRNED